MSMKTKYTLSGEWSLPDLERIYKEVVLSKAFYDDSYGGDWTLRPYEEMALALSALFPNARHLDVGCGKGFLVQAMRQLGLDSFGLDFSDALISQCDERIKNCLFSVTAEHWTQKAVLTDFDLITYMEVFEHLPISVLEQILTSLRTGFEGVVFATIPSHGIDDRFGVGLHVDAQNPAWQRDMLLNRPFRNIVLENGVPHCGHLMLASYRWWTDFFLCHGFARSRDREVALNAQFGSILRRYLWKPYILEGEKGKNLPHRSIRSGVALGSGWHNYEAEVDARWTDGFAEMVFSGPMASKVAVSLTMSAPEVNVVRDFYGIVSLDRLVRTNDWSFQWKSVFPPSRTVFERRGDMTTMRVPMVGDDEGAHSVFSDGENDAGHWRLSLISPAFSPYDYGLSSDPRRLGVLVRDVSLDYV